MSDKRYKKVEGSQGRFRDPYNNAIINMNVDEIKKARELKAARKQKALEFEQVKEDVQQMKSDMSDIKSLLQKLVDK